MKTASVPSPLNLNVLLIALLFAALVFIVVTGRRVPVVSNTRIAMVILLVLGMTMCQISGIGRVAALGVWTHPLSILGYVLGAAILVIGLATVFGWKLPYLQNDTQAIVIVAILTGVKIVNAVAHSLLSRGG
jgi:hypothetical protein